ncbi:hypothetical protein [Aquabacter spiritensis]|uniref:HAMP domain-containing protein n=1 Tax=Aquabacter spiritensis TaxID=933073 RepID=A0A4R3M436_9HYPH|nr:hypothetical protein [Aquabacter spiritensis]TCT07990.1 hypothetical protein EDC64_101509 [Aquabacter spiritensis]
MSFVGRLLLVVGCSLAITLMAVAGAAFLAGQQVGEEIEQARVSHLLGTLRAATEGNLAIGLALDEISLLQSLIEREKASDPAIVAIDVFNGAGRSIYSTDRGFVGETVEPGWVSHLSRDGLWQTQMHGEAVFGTRFENDLGVAGGIAVTVSGLTRIARTELLGVDLTVRILGAGAATLAAGLLVALAFAGWVGAPFRRVARILDGAARPSVRGSRLERLAARVRESWSRAEDQLARGSARLEELDDVG